ncbi:MAG TPA: hypothetical protein VEC57_08185 [Candidatus Limnocylindrales bacterium]|nr:hypothetical protein [Candidatus Limnocylindrales bacterium]
MRLPAPSRTSLTAGVLLLLAYALPLYVAPDPQPTRLITPLTPMIERLFPGVPPMWIVARLLCVLAGAAALVLATRPRGVASFRHAGSFLGRDAGGAEAADSDHAGVNPTDADRPEAPRLQRDHTLRPAHPLVVLAALLLCAAPLAGAATRGVQLAYIAALLVPAAVAVVRVHVRMPWRTQALPWAIALAWVAQRLPDAFGSVRVADAVDYLPVYRCFEIAAAADTSLLTQGCWTGYTLAPLIFQGNGVLGWSGIPLSMPIIQSVSAFWTAVVAAMLGTMAGRTWGVACGALAAAVFLWSPLVLLRLLVPGAPSHTVVVAGLLVLALALARRPEPWAAAGFGALTGMAVLLPNSVVVAALLAVAMMAVLRKRWPLLALAAAFALAALLPGSATIPDMIETARSQASASVAWAPLDGYFTGRTAPSLAETTNLAARDATVDVVAGLLLSPLAVARASTRLWGDVVIEPLGAALFVVGVLAAFAGLRRWIPRLLLLLLIAAAAPAAVSSYDRVVPLRIELALPVALVAAFGLHRLLRAWPAAAASMRAGSAIALLVAVSGTFLFDHVNARILAPSAAGLAMRAMADVEDAPAWSMHLAGGSSDVARILSEQVIGRSVQWWDPLDADRSALENAAGLLWTPGEQMERQVGHDVCRLRTELSLQEAADASGRTRLFAALQRPPSAGGSVQWRARSCTETLPTDATIAGHALQRAAELARSGRRDEAVSVLHEAATSTLVQPRLYRPLATLLAERDSSGDRTNAKFWATLACAAGEGADAQACALAASL